MGGLVLTSQTRPVVFEMEEHEAQFVLDLVRQKKLSASLETGGVMSAYWTRIFNRVQAGIEGHYERARLAEQEQSSG